ncbi:unnamed protein product [Lampetra fluviatilis]
MIRCEISPSRARPGGVFPTCRVVARFLTTTSVAEGPTAAALFCQQNCGGGSITDSFRPTTGPHARLFHTWDRGRRRGARQRRKLRGEGEEEEATAIAGERLLLLRKRSYCCCCSVSPRTVRKPAELHGHRGHVAATRGARRDALGCLRASGTVERAHSTWNSNKKVSPGINHWRRVHTSHLQGPPPVSLNTRTAKA